MHDNHTHLIAAVALVPLFVISHGLQAEELVLIEDGASRAPIVIFKDAPPFTRDAADELAEYLGKTSGAKPKVIEGEARPVPDDAIWVECQPTPTRLFPKIDTDTTRLDCASTQRPKSAR